MDLSPQAWTAIWATVALIAVLCLLCFGPPAWEAARAQQYRRETARLEGRTTARREWHPVRRVNLLAALVAELTVRAAFWLATKAMRTDRTGVGR